MHSTTRLTSLSIIKSKPTLAFNHVGWASAKLFTYLVVALLLNLYSLSVLIMTNSFLFLIYKHEVIFFRSPIISHFTHNLWVWLLHCHITIPTHLYYQLYRLLRVLVTPRDSLLYVTVTIQLQVFVMCYIGEQLSQHCLPITPKDCVELRLHVLCRTHKLQY